MSFARFLKDVGTRLLRSQIESAVRKPVRKPGGRGADRQEGRDVPVPSTSREASARGGAGGIQTARAANQLPGPRDVPRVYSIEGLGLPRFDYAPSRNDRPDPGEVVWAWVPYEEDRARGKDRPVLVLAEVERCIVFVQLTSKDHDRDAAQEARNGRHWIDVGAGPWDPKGRPSEARIDRLLCVHPDGVRREGGRLDESRFAEVVATIRAFHG